MYTTETTRDSDKATRTKEASREARVTQGKSGSPLGAAVWLNAEELSALGVDLTAADWVAYRVSEGEIHFYVESDE